MDVLVSALEILMRWDVILALLVGSVGGVVIGAIPGVGPCCCNCNPIARDIFHGSNCGFNHTVGHLRIVNVRRRDTSNSDQYAWNRR